MQMKIYALIGHGDRGTQLPCLLHTDKAELERVISAVLGPPEYGYWTPKPDTFCNESWKSFFTYYYDGEECFQFNIKEVTPGLPFVFWNFDDILKT